jgi:tetratricopeptide (TPR) repeat protein
MVNSPNSKRSPFSNSRKWVSLVAFVCVFSACTLSSEKIEFERAQKSERAGKHEEALLHYKSVVERFKTSATAIKSAQEAARLDQFELKNYKEAIEMYRHVILYSPSERERIEAQRKIADIYFTNFTDYNQAVTEYNRLLELPGTAEETATYRLAIARSYFYLNNFYQSQVELDRIVKDNSKTKPLVFEALLLKANIFLTTKHLDDAIEVLKRLIVENPERAKAESIALVLEVCYEEQKNFAKAIEVLQSMPVTEGRRGFIANKIKALRERQSYLPGAKGLKK